MKFIIATFLIVISISCLSQTPYNPDLFELDKNSKVTAQKVIEVPGKSANEIYLQAKRWLASKYQVPEDVMLTSIENEMIRIKDSKRFVRNTKPLPEDMRLHFEYQIDIKDGKCRMTFTNLLFNYEGNEKQFPLDVDLYTINMEKKTGKSAERTRQPTTIIVQEIMDSFTKSLTTTSSDW